MLMVGIYIQYIYICKYIYMVRISTNTKIYIVMVRIFTDAKNLY